MYAEKELKKELYEIKSFLTSLIGSIPAGIIAIDLTGAIIVANQEALMLLGKDISVNEIIDKELRQYIQDIPQLDEIITKQIKTPREDFVISAITRETGSKKTYIEVRGKIISKGLLLLLTDISEIKMLDEMKTEFVSVASHELRTPLTAIDGIVSMIRDGEYGPIAESLKQPLEDVNTSSERLIHLVNDLLNISRLQAGKLKYTLSETDIKPIVEGIVKMLQVIAEPKGLKLSTSDINSITVLSDVNKVEQILDNLIGNSLKFTDKGSVILSTKLSEDKVIIFITDTGIGIGKEDLGKLFGRFEKLESGLGRPAGTGLGLHISREMARKMGGDVWLEKSEKGKGSTFALSIPIAKSQLASKVNEMIAKNS